MRPNQSSVTAENNAVIRAHESMRPESERICNDTYAVYFLPDRFLSATDRKEQINQSISDWEKHFPGVCNSIIARTRFIDDCLQEAVKAGIRQLVILGAGYDTRSLRFESLKNKVVVFELDHPKTQKTKLKRIKLYVVADLSNVRYIPFDFYTDLLDKKLFAHGYDDHLTTLFIWEGVTYYLCPSAIDRTLLFIAQHSALKSSLIFDYFPPTVANGTTRLTEARALREGLRHIGEEIVFGIEPDRVIDFMGARGFTVIKNIQSNVYKQAYFKGINRSRKVSEMFKFLQARVS